MQFPFYLKLSETDTPRINQGPKLEEERINFRFQVLILEEIYLDTVTNYLHNTNDPKVSSFSCVRSQFTVCQTRQICYRYTCEDIMFKCSLFSFRPWDWLSKSLWSENPKEIGNLKSWLSLPDIGSIVKASWDWVKVIWNSKSTGQLHCKGITYFLL